MTRDELLVALRDLEKRLRSAEVQGFFERQSQDIRDSFVSFRQDVSFLIGKLTNAQLEDIADRLDALSKEFKAGINDLQGEIDTLKDAVAIINVLSTVLSLAARIALLAA